MTPQEPLTPELTPEQLAVVESIDDTATRQALTDIWTTENDTLRGDDNR